MSCTIEGSAMNRIDYNVLIGPATELFGGRRDWANKWLDTPTHALGGISPRQAVMEGRREEVLRLLSGRNHGEM